MLGQPGAIEREIAQLIIEQAWRAAQRLLDDRERPEDGADLFSVAVAACYTELQRRIIQGSAQTLRGL